MSRLSPSTLVVIRVLLVADALLVVGLGGMAAAFVDHPAGWILAGGAWSGALVLLACVPLTDPYRQEERQRRAARLRRRDDFS